MPASSRFAETFVGTTATKMPENLTVFHYTIKKEIQQHLFPSEIQELFFPDTTSGLLSKGA